MTIHVLSAEQTRPLRHRVLRPHQPLEACVYPLDEVEDSFHVGASDDGSLVSVASMYHEAPESEHDEGDWRIRGMATLEEVRGRGYGRALVEACLDYARAQGGRRVWCNARTTAAGFYERCGFSIVGDEYDLPGIGPHVFMETPLDTSAS